MIKNYFRTAWRTFNKYRFVNLLNILGLSAGMTAAVLIFLWVQNELSYDSYHTDANRLYRVTTHITSAKWTWETSPFNLTGAIRTELPQVEAVTSFQSAYDFNIRIGDEIFTEKNAAYIDSAWFNLFHYGFIKGNAAALFSHPYSLILTQTKAKKYFGDKDPVGHTLRIDTVDYRIAGVIKDVPSNSSFQFDVLLPIEALLTNPERRKNETQWGNFNFQTFLKLRPGVAPEKIAAATTGILIRNGDKEDNKNFISLIPLKAIHFETDLTNSGGDIIHGNRSTVTIFSILGIFLLLIACINYVNLTTARASLRAKEVGIRKIIGAGKNSLFLQFIVESFMISAIALLVTTFLVQLSLPLFRQLTDKQFPSPFTLIATWKILGITLLTTIILTGAYPAMLISSFRPLNVLKGATILKFKDVWLRKGLVVLQFTFSIILIIGTLIIQRQLSYIQNTDPGYNRSQVFSVRIPSTPAATIKQQLLEQPGVTGVSVASQTIVGLSSSNSGSSDWDGHDPSFSPTLYQVSTDEDYQKVMQLQMAQGRWFDPQNQLDRHNFILNETAINTLNIRKPVLGQRFTFQGDTGKIIGIVKDFHFHSLHEKIKPLVMFNTQNWRSTFFIKTAPGGSTRALAAARAIALRYNPSKPFDYSFLDDQFDNLYRLDKKVSTLILIFSVIAILISCLGLFGLAAFTARQKVKEIGIRKVLGASVTSIVALISKDFVRLVLLSIVIAIPISWWVMHQWLQEFAYHISLSAWIFLLGGAMALLIAIITVSTQSIRAAAANPIKNLRTE